MNIEIFTAAEQCFLAAVYLYRLALRLCIIFRRAKLGNVYSLFNMKLSGLSVLSYSAVVIYSVCRIAVLLNLGNKYTLADSVERTRLDEEHISLMNGNIVSDLKQGIILYSVRKFFS